MRHINRRNFLLGLGAVGFVPASKTYFPLTVYNPIADISAGQSWQSNSFNSMGLFDLNPQAQTLMCLHAPNSNPAGVPVTPGCLAAGAGIFVPTTPNSISGYNSTSPVSIGRCAAMAEQLLKLRSGRTPVPIIEFNMAYPGSDWDTTGGNGGGAGSYCGGDWAFGLQPCSHPWANGLAQMSAISNLFPFDDIAAGRHLNAPSYRSISWVQGGDIGTGGGSDKTLTITQFQNMCNAYDALNLAGVGTSGLKFFVPIRAALSTDTNITNQAQYQGIFDFCVQNFNGRIIPTVPWYQWPFIGPFDVENTPGVAEGNIHTGSYGTIRHGEALGLARYITYTEGVDFTPLWVPSSANLSRSGQDVFVTFNRPAGAEFASSVLSWQSLPNDGIQVWPQNGFQIYRSGSPLTVTPTIIPNTLTVQLSIAEPVSPSDSLQVTYAMYGPGGSDPGLQSGIGGNLVMNGPPSVFFDNNTIDAWAWPFNYTV